MTKPEFVFIKLCQQTPNFKFLPAPTSQDGTSTFKGNLAPAKPDVSAKAIQLPTLKSVSVYPKGMNHWGSIAESVAVQNKVDPKIFKSMITTESHGDPYAVSPKGAFGLAQLMPETMKARKVDTLSSPVDILNAGAKELAQNNRIFKNDSMAVAAYNNGAGNVLSNIKQYGKFTLEKLPTETQDYVRKVFSGITP